MYNSFHDWIETHLPEGSTILEFGSGPGTERLGSKFKMFSIEHDATWVGTSKKSTYVHAPIVNRWYDVNAVKVLLSKIEKYDLVLVDGPTGKIGRKGLLKNLELFNDKVIWVFDDVNRPNELKIMKDFCNKSNKSFVIYKGENRSFAITNYYTIL
jgi:hypothetical protein